MRVLARLWKEESGQDLTEYALLLVLLILAAVSTFGTLANSIGTAFLAAASSRFRALTIAAMLTGCRQDEQAQTYCLHKRQRIILQRRDGELQRGR